MLTPQSNILVDDIINEMNADPDFASLSDDEKIQTALSAQGAVFQDCIRSGFRYDSDTVVSQALPAGGGGSGGGGSANMRVTTGVATKSGVEVRWLVNNVVTPLANAVSAVAFDIDGTPLQVGKLAGETTFNKGCMVYSVVDGVPFTAYGYAST